MIGDGLMDPEILDKRVGDLNLTQDPAERIDGLAKAVVLFQEAATCALNGYKAVAHDTPMTHNLNELVRKGSEFANGTRVKLN